MSDRPYMIASRVLLICSATALGIGVPAWALASGDLNRVAGWATVLALSTSSLALVLMAGGRRTGSGEHPERRPPPRMAPHVDGLVDRPDVGRRLVAALTASTPGAAGLITALHGAGGFGKTTLAAWACQQAEVARRFPGGLLWLTLGQEPRFTVLAEKINDLVFTLSGRRPTTSDPEIAGFELSRAVRQGRPVLLVLDDVWSEAQLRPFRVGGAWCTTLVTTRRRDLPPTGGQSIRVDAMIDDQAEQMIRSGVDGLPEELVTELAQLAGCWPVLLALVNGAIRRRVEQGEASGEACRQIAERLRTHGPAAFDSSVPAERSRAVAATVEASLSLLTADDQRAFIDLAGFPDEVEIPLMVLKLIWPGRAESLCEDFVALGLADALRRDSPGPRLVIHDVIRGYLRRRTNGHTSESHRRLIRAAEALLPERESADGDRAPWWRLPAEQTYLWRYLPWHMREAGLAGVLYRLVCDLRWVEEKTRRFGSVLQVTSDLELIDTSLSNGLREALRRSAGVLGPIDPPGALGATLASRLAGYSELIPTVDAYRRSLPVPRLEPMWPLADLPHAHTAAADAAAGHVGSITACAFSPDGRLLASASDDGTVRLWRWQDGAGVQEAMLQGHTGGIWAVAFSPDGVKLATAGDDGNVRLWNLETGTSTLLMGHTGWVRSCDFSPDGRTLASTGDDGTVRLWNSADGSPGLLASRAGGIRHCRFSPDGELLAGAAEDGSLLIWGIANRTIHLTLRGHDAAARTCEFSPDGSTLVSSGDDATLRIWELATGMEKMVIRVLGDNTLSCVFSPDGGTIASTGYGAIRLWNVADGSERAAFRGHSSAVWACSFSPDGRTLASAGVDQALRVWRVSDGRCVIAIESEGGRMDGCDISADGRFLATAAVDGVCRVWRISNGELDAEYSGHTGKVSGCRFSPGSDLLASVGNDRTTRLWRLADRTQYSVLAGHTDWVRGCAFSPDGTMLATAGTDQTVRLWDITDQTAVVLTGHTGRVYTCAFSPDGLLLASGATDRTLRVWRLSDRTSRILRGHTDLLNSCVFSPDGRLLASASDDQSVRLWRVSDGSNVGVLRGHTGWVDACAFSPDGTRLASVSSDGTLRVWQVATTECESAIRVAAPLVAVVWHPDGEMLGASGGAGVYLFRYLH